MQDAIYYAGAYLTLPEGFDSFAAFKAYAESAALPLSIKTHVLREGQNIPLWTVEKGICMAPYFIDGYFDTPSTVLIEDPSQLFPTQVELLSQEEYNRRLRELVLAYCPGCIRYKPLSNRVQSLNGHFEEISLDGFCAFRCETKPSPRVLREKLRWMRGSLYHVPEAFTPEELAHWAKSYFSVKLRQVTVLDEGDLLRAEASADGGVFERMIASLWAEEFTMACNGKCRVQMREPGDPTEAELEELLSPAGEAAFRKACKKYGVSLLLIRCSEAGEDPYPLFPVLADMEGRDLLAIVRMEKGQSLCLALDTANALKQLRYHSPRLQPIGARVTVAGQFGTKSYEISYAMKEI